MFAWFFRLISALSHLLALFIAFLDVRAKPPSDVLIFIVKYPAAGRSKNRLAPTYSPQQAAHIQRQLIQHAIAVARQLRVTHNLEIQVHYSGCDLAQMHEWLGNDLTFLQQAPGSIGDRFEASFVNAFQAGAKRVIVVGSDTPGVTPQLLSEAFNELKDKRSCLCLGPALDNGYYLIGFNREELARQLFVIDWGAPSIYRQTLHVARNLPPNVRPRRITSLPTLGDVSTPESVAGLWHCERDRVASEAAMPDNHITVIIPTINAQATIELTLRQLYRMHGSGVSNGDDGAEAAGWNIDVIVADGGSSDETRAVARSLHATVIQPSIKGPTTMQLQREAVKAAGGGILVFLKHDSLLPRGWDDMIRFALQQPLNLAGSFEFRASARVPGISLVERMLSWRAHTLGFPSGSQQVLFMRSDVYTEYGGFDSRHAYLADSALLHRFSQVGNVVNCYAPAISARPAERWRQQQQQALVPGLSGWFYSWLLLHELDFPPQLLARWAPRVP